ncbi:GNAT superfamily N-acetyltransferase [Sphingobium wenxiniae]|uniref:N-acetyltransferase GCN5 n=2 Tax=Sphingobium TaxID=165695 RepID=T0HVF5_9SPHN|nr:MULTISPECIES: GNAT family N-acetyltransferase [Sphingobium]EQB01499.1 N-acetyltransferase GCN5 [Sphingobium baderi LL03]KMS60486.1 N-acetyltransferase GCN5 [Sphingobium baderi LL03]MBB6193055.1 GNAT superfamily N-acetyltransferase [Sphingobium wenxiniae]TWH90379.1 ribosomal protein S18 acetylase RimI-like enzyme [Sphingobium wenxiniae]WRD76411.1 GNAT family N-acetyltransferase [Sphingobium baderi]
MSLTPVERGQVAAIVTHLEMRERPRPAPIPSAPLRLVPWKEPGLDAYRALFRRVGAPWLWFSRLVMDDAALSAIIHDPAVAVYAVTDPRGVEVGLLELDFRSPPDCELAFIGLIPDLNGKGFGQWLMAQAKALAWRKDVERFRVHTCTLDSPAALGFYRKHGFRPVAREVEIFADPRLAGVLPRDAAPQVPLLD